MTACVFWLMCVTTLRRGLCINQRPEVACSARWNSLLFWLFLTRITVNIWIFSQACGHGDWHVVVTWHASHLGWISTVYLPSTSLLKMPISADLTLMLLFYTLVHFYLNISKNSLSLLFFFLQYLPNTHVFWIIFYMSYWNLTV